MTRFERVRARMAELDVDTMLLSNGSELPWLVGYHADTRERLKMLIVPRDGEPVLVAPLMEQLKIRELSGFEYVPWKDGVDPVEIVAKYCSGNIAVGDQTWSKFTLELQQQVDAKWTSATPVISPLREVKDADEIALLEAAGAANDRVADKFLYGEIKFVGRTERQVADDISAAMIAEGFQYIDFMHVGSGPNGANPHHDVSDRVIQENELVVCDFGGPIDYYFADTTRTVITGEPTERQREIYETVKTAQETAFNAAKVGVTGKDVDKAARDVITAAGYGENFIHRTGHGIGFEVHEPVDMAPYNSKPIVAGNAFSIEPGIYINDELGVRIEDIVVATDEGPRRLNGASRELTIVE